jgi:hypothetical protein
LDTSKFDVVTDFSRRWPSGKRARRRAYCQILGGQMGAEKAKKLVMAAGLGEPESSVGRPKDKRSPSE